MSEADPINRIPRDEVNVIMVETWNVNAVDTDEGKQVVLLQDIPAAEDTKAVVGLPLSTPEEVDNLIVDLRRMKALVWPASGEPNADHTNGNDFTVDSETPYGREVPGAGPNQEPDRQSPG